MEQQERIFFDTLEEVIVASGGEIVSYEHDGLFVAGAGDYEKLANMFGIPVKEKPHPRTENEWRTKWWGEVESEADLLRACRREVDPEARAAVDLEGEADLLRACCREADPEAHGPSAAADFEDNQPLVSPAVAQKIDTDDEAPLVRPASVHQDNEDDRQQL